MLIKISFALSQAQKKRATEIGALGVIRGLYIIHFLCYLFQQSQHIFLIMNSKLVL